MKEKTVSCWQFEALPPCLRNLRLEYLLRVINMSSQIHQFAPDSGSIHDTFIARSRYLNMSTNFECVFTGLICVHFRPNLRPF